MSDKIDTMMQALLDVIDARIEEEFAAREVDESGYTGSIHKEREVTQRAVTILRRAIAAEITELEESVKG